MDNRFDEFLQRKGTDSYKWDEIDPATPDVIPMWVADMDFATAPCIIDALKKRVDHGAFGYTSVPQTYYSAVTSWFSRRHDWQIERDWIQYTSGVVPALSATIKALTEPSDKVILQTPVFNCFFSSIRNNACEIIDSPLIYVEGDEKNLPTYRMDFEDLEKKCSDPSAKLLVLCNPHNPAGRVWTREELAKVGQICRRNNVIVISDEIHCELVMPGNKFIPFASASAGNQDCSITLNSPSKAFNTAGLQITNIITNNQSWAARINKAININEVCDVNPFGVIALQAAYGVPGSSRYPIGPGEEWLDGLLSVIHRNYLLLLETFKRKVPEIPVTKMEGTYLAWADCQVILDRKGFSSCKEIEEYLLKNKQAWITAGDTYGCGRFIRINLACPLPTLEKGLERIVGGLGELLGQ